MGSFKKVSVTSALAAPVAAAVCMIAGCASDNTSIGDEVKMPPRAYVAGEPAAVKVEAPVPVPAEAEAPKEAELAPVTVTEEAAPAEPAPAPVEAAAPDKVVYTVRQGETLWSIAKIYGLDERTIAVENGIPVDKALTAGDKLIIPNGGKNVDPAVQVTLLAPAAPVKPIDKGDTYTVQKGDSFWKIANRCDISADALAAANGLDPKKPLKVGTVLTIPSGTAVKAAAKKEDKKETKAVKQETAKADKAQTKKAEAPKADEPKKAPAEKAVEPEVSTDDAGEMDTISIVIEREMDLEEISSLYDRPYDLLKKANPNVKPGEKLPANSSVLIPIML